VQKLHAVAVPANARTHDLVNLHLHLHLLRDAGADLPSLLHLCVRTFDWRRQQARPTLPLRPMGGWERACTDARTETPIDGQTPTLLDITAARGWGPPHRPSRAAPVPCADHHQGREKSRSRRCNLHP